MSLLDFFRRRGSAPIARERLQILLAHERADLSHPDLLAKLRDDILAVVTSHINVENDQVHVSVDRGDTVSVIEINVEIPNALGAIAVAR